jgi:hypothetical protein
MFVQIRLYLKRVLNTYVVMCIEIKESYVVM